MPETSNDIGPDQEYVNRFRDAMKAEDVRGWLVERLENCVSIAKAKTGIDKRGWLEDAAFFSAAIGLIDWTADDHAENRDPNHRTN